MKVLVTGGLGYVGVNVVYELLCYREYWDIVVLDNGVHSTGENLDKVQNQFPKANISRVFVDLTSLSALENFFNRQKKQFDIVIHLAGYKSVSQSIEDPLLYYQNNVLSTINLLTMMKKYDIHYIVFSSSATVYSNNIPGKETDMLNPNNPYGNSKWMIEKMLQDLCMSDKQFHCIILRFFNPVGVSQYVGESIFQDKPDNLFPYLVKVLLKTQSHLNIYGNDYTETKDGTPARDFIHITDVAKGHVCAIKKFLDPHTNKNFAIYNLGSGKAYTVLEVIKCFESLLNKKIPYEFKERRKGDVPVLYACTELAQKELSFQTTKTLRDICQDVINFYLK